MAEQFSSLEAYFLLKAMEELLETEERADPDGVNIHPQKEIIRKLNQLERRYGGDPNRIVLREV